GSDDTTVKLWDMATKQELTTFRGHTNYIYSLAFSPDSKVLATVAMDDSIKLWDTAIERDTDVVHSPELMVLGHAAFSRDGKTLALPNGLPNKDGTVELWDVATSRRVARLRGHTAEVGCTAFSPDGKTLASAGRDKTVRLWDVASRRN